VFDILRAPDVAFVLVASPEPLTVDEALYFHGRLQQSAMPLGGFVVNRVHPRLPDPLGREALIEKLIARPELRGLQPDDLVQVAADLDRTYRDFSTLAALDAKEIDRLRAQAGGAPVVEVPFFDRDIYDLDGLRTMIRYLAAG
jgi:anion-transporting  ArsA/GET3 family ATPase